MECVADSSIFLAWVLPGEGHRHADKLFDLIVTQRGLLWVPSLWWYEVANALIVGERRKRITEAENSEITALLKKLPLQTDSDLNPDTLWRCRSLAQEHGLSAYDAAYLELSGRLGVALATLDDKLTKAAKKAGVKTVQ